MTDQAPPNVTPSVAPIDAAAISRWIAIPEEKEIVVHITRKSFDNLYFAIQELTSAVIKSQDAAVSAAVGDSPAVQAQIADSRYHALRSIDHLSRMMEAVMRAAQPNG